MLHISEIICKQMLGHGDGAFGILDIRGEKVWQVYIPIHSTEELHSTWSAKTFGGNLTIDEVTEKNLKDILEDEMFKFSDAVGYIHVGQNPNHRKIADMLFKITNREFLYELVFDKDKITSVCKILKPEIYALDYKID